MSISRVCLPPSIVYAMQGPFPMEIHQASELIVIKLEYYDMVRIIFMDGREAIQTRRRIRRSATRSAAGMAPRSSWTRSRSANRRSPTTVSITATRSTSSSDSGWVLVAARFSACRSSRIPRCSRTEGARFMAWDRVPDEFVLPYECDPSFALNYSSDAPRK